jgi:hypothetical protein
MEHLPNSSLYLSRQPSRVAAGSGFVEFGGDVPPRPLIAEVRRQMLRNERADVASVVSVVTFGMTSGRGRRSDQSARAINGAAPCRDQSSPARSGTLPAAHRYRRSGCKPRKACRRRTRIGALARAAPWPVRPYDVTPRMPRRADLAAGVCTAPMSSTALTSAKNVSLWPETEVPNCQTNV